MIDGCVPWPEEVRSRFIAEGYWRSTTILESLRSIAVKYPDKVAIADGDKQVSYSELERTIDRMAAGWIDLGICSSKRVVVHLPNIADFVFVLLSLLRAGAIPVLALPSHRMREISYLIDKSEAVAYVCPDRYQGFDYAHICENISVENIFVSGVPHGECLSLRSLDRDPSCFPDISLDEVALFLLSGGTTGLPKLIPRTHYDLECAIRYSSSNAELGPSDVYLAMLPIAHNYALAAPGILGTLLSGGMVVLGAGPDVESSFAAISKHAVTVTGLVPVVANLWIDDSLRSRYDLSSLRLVQLGAAEVSTSDVLRFVSAFECKVQQSFGMAEGMLSQSRPGDSLGTVAATQGHPVCPADDIMVVGQDGEELPSGVSGELLVRGPYTIRGYYQSPDYNSSAFTDDGFMHTGDLARITESGYLIVDGRIKDQINRAGEMVSASEVEGFLNSMSGIVRSAVVPASDPILGERSCAYVVLAPNFPEPRISDVSVQLRADGLADYKIPDVLYIVSDIPLTSVGKYDKKKLRIMAEGS